MNDTETIIPPGVRYIRNKPTDEQRRELENRISDWPEMDKQIAKELLAGDSLKEIAARHKIHATRARGVAHVIGWNPHWRNLARMFEPRRKITLSLETILKLYTENRATLQQIGDIAGGVTRERIRQLLITAGHNPIDWREHHKEETWAKRETANAIRRNKTKEARRKHHEEHYAKARLLWDQGKPAQEIADAYGVSYLGLLATICKLRKSDGWFPYRRPPHQ